MGVQWGMLEANFDGLVGPTHNYAGLSYGNVASSSNAGSASRPKDAALQGLAKMKRLAEMGLVQGILPPHERPHLPTLRSLGFAGSDEEILERVSREDPVLLAQACSASCMWTANAATVSASADASDGKVHFTPANLRAMFHRSIEPATTSRVLRAIFPEASGRFAHHAPLPSADQYGDEGAANHTRLCDDSHPGAGEQGAGVNLFVYGVHYGNRNAARPQRYPARQTLQASQAIARIHGLDPVRTVITQQNPAVIDEGVFHNDVIAVGNGRVLFYHELAFSSEHTVIATLADLIGDAFTPVQVMKEEVSVGECVASYLFNSQLITKPDGSMCLIAPAECEENERVKAVIDRVIAEPHNPIRDVLYMNLRESMRNGGGPACLRLRVPLTDDEVKAVNPACLATPEKLFELEAWVRRNYRDELVPDDLADPQFLRETRKALDELTGILSLGSVYEFQR